TEDPSGALFRDPPSDDALPVTRIRWAAADALPFPLCLGVAERPGEVFSVALGNIVLADHGRTLPDESLPVVSDAVRRHAPGPRDADRCGARPATEVPVRYRPMLAESPVTQGFALVELLAASSDSTAAPWWPASQLLSLDPRHALPHVRLHDGSGTPQREWEPRRDLLRSGAGAPHFVVETDHDARARLRFGDD